MTDPSRPPHRADSDPGHPTPTRALPFHTLLPVLVLALAVAWLGSQGYRINHRDEAVALLTVNDLLRSDSEVNKLLLQLRFGASRNYDPLVAELGRMQAKLSDLKTRVPRLSDELRTRYDVTIAALEWRLISKTHLIEDFKSDNALLRNSLLFLPGTIAQFDRQLTDAVTDSGVRSNLLRLSRAMLTVADASATGQTNDIGHLIQALDFKVLAASRPDELERLLDHARLIERLTPSVDQLLRRATALSLEDSAGDLIAVLNDGIEREHSYHQAYNLLLVLVTALLLVYLVALYRRLNRRTAQLTSSHARLQAEVAQREHAQALLTAQAQVLEPMVRNAPLKQVLETLCESIEKLTPGSMAAVLLSNADHSMLGNGVSLSLPPTYGAALDQLPIGPDHGSCGTAAFLGEPVLVTDIQQDPRWARYRELAREHGIGACWSAPFFSRNDTVLGTFSLSYSQPHSPGVREREILARASKLATIAVEHDRAEREATAGRERYRHIFDAVPVSLWEQDYSRIKTRLDALTNEGIDDLPGWLDDHPDTLIELMDGIDASQVNRATLEMFGAPDLETLLQHRKALVSFESMDSIRDRLVSLAEGKRLYRGNTTYKTLSGQRIEVMVSIAFPAPDSDFSQVLVSVLDITALKQAEAELQDAKELAETTLDSIADGVITTDRNGNINTLNPTAHTLTGWPGEEAIGQPIDEVLPLIDQWSNQRLPVPVSRCLLEQRPIPMGEHIGIIDRNGKEHGIEVSTAPLRHSVHQSGGSAIIIRDVTETRRLARELVHQASHDSLTGLINRRAFEERLEAALSTAQDEDRSHALCFLDLDQFKIVNDTCGHVAGDELLKRLSARLRSKIRGRDTLGRLGGDEFAVLLEDCPLERAEEISDDLRKTVQDFRFTWDGRKFELGVSIGVTAITSRAQSCARLLSEADVACYAAKDLGRNRVHIHQPEDLETEQRHRELQWAADLTNALDQNRFRLFCQPLAALTDDREPPHYEVLLRLRDVEGNEVMPGAFIPAAERYNLMQSIDRWTIEHTFAFYAKHLAHPSRPPITLAINLSGNSLSREGLVPYILDQSRRFDIPPERFCFEVTETAAIGNIGQAAEFIRQLKARGFLFALDDFGTGLSSFAYLKNLPVDYLKIDGAFVRDMDTDPADEAMVRAINQIGHTMGKKTIAEWAENDAIVARLGEMEVDFAQGYAIGRPRPIAEVFGVESDTSGEGS